MKKIALTLLACFILVPIVIFGVLYYTEFLWYQNLGFAPVFITSLISRSIVWLVFAGIAGGTLWLTGQATLKRMGAKNSRILRALVPTTAVILATLSSIYIASQWMVFRLAVLGAPFDIIEPVTKLDAGFFVFTLPAFELIVSWFLGLTILCALWVGALIALVPKKDATTEVGYLVKLFNPYAFRLFGLLMMLAGMNFILNAYGLLYSQTGLVPGASAIDSAINFPGSIGVGAVALLVGITTLLRAHKQNLKTVGYIFAVWAVAAFSTLSIAPVLYHSLVIAPNEITQEVPYIENALSMTRVAWELDSINEDTYPALPTVAPSKVEAAKEELLRARIWTPDSVKQAFKQLETVRPYYKLSSIEPDRYSINGTIQEVLVTAREIKPSGLGKNADNWINRHLVYTHGYGMSIAGASKVSADGFPEFFVGNVPPELTSSVATGSPDLATTEPRIYFGDTTSDYAIVNTKLDEFDHAQGTQNITNRYKASGGIEVSSLTEKLLWATKLASPELILSSYIKPESKILMYRDISTRTSKIAPWLTVDKTPYPALVDGRILWILDGYTSSDHFPYSKAFKETGANYLRNSVKIVMDAYTGELTFYAFGRDPIRDAWAKIYPGVITSSTKTPASLSMHFRYPKTLLSAQAEIFKTYHMNTVNTFYNKEDLWGMFKNTDGSSFGSSYHIIDMPNSTKSEYSLVQPYSASNKDNMISILSVSCDPDTYGEKTVYLLPRERVILGPNQITARIKQDPAIAPQLSLWNQNGNTVVYGEMLVLPIQESITYVQPIFLRAKDASITEVVGVVVVNDNHIRMGKTVEDALNLAYAETTSK